MNAGATSNPGTSQTLVPHTGHGMHARKLREGHARRGLCTNALSVRESVVRASLLDGLRRRLVSDRGLAYARKRVAEKLGELSREQDAEIRERTQRLAKLDAQIAKLVDFIAEENASSAVADKLRKLELDADTEPAR